MMGRRSRSICVERDRPHRLKRGGQLLNVLAAAAAVTLGSIGAKAADPEYGNYYARRAVSQFYRAQETARSVGFPGRPSSRR